MNRVHANDIAGGDVVTPADQRINIHHPPRSCRTHRRTPYHKTPGTRRLRDSTRTPFSRRTANADVVPDSASDLLTKTWRLYKLSPLYKFNYTKLRQYQRLLASHIQAETKKIAIGLSNLDEETANAARIEKLEGYTVQDDDPDAVKILLQQKKSKNTEARTVLSAVLCCVGGGEEQQQQRDFTYLPLMLVKGPVGLTRSLHSWMESMFDSYISPVTFSATSLTWILSMWAGYLPEQGRSKKVELTYEVPACIQELSTISLAIDPAQCQRLWEGVRSQPTSQQQYNQDFSAEEVVSFMKSIQHHFYRHFRIHLQAMKLSRVGTSIAYVGNEGKLKMFSKSHVKQVLGLVTELVIEQSWI